MDPSDFFDHPTLQMSIFSKNPCSLYPPSCQEPPRHSLIQHLQPATPRQTGRMHGSNMSLQRNLDPILERQNLPIEIRSKVGTESNILGVKKKRMDDFSWNQNFPQVKKMRPESHEQSENIGRKKINDRNELKEQVGQLKERLMTLQEKVWRAFAQQHWSQNDRKWRKLSEDKNIGVDSEEDLFANVPKKHTGSQGPKDVLVEAGERTLGWTCTELYRGDWDGEQGMVENGCQLLAQLLKVELRNAMAMVIDRVLTIYNEASEPELSSPPAVSFVAEANEKWGILKKISKRAHEMDRKECNTAPRQSNQPTEAMAVRIQLPPFVTSGPSLISPGPLSKDPFFSSHPGAPLAPRYPPFHPLQSMDTLPLLHYSMHQLFSRTLSHMPSPSVKNLHVNREPMTELERPVFCVPMPLLELPEPPLSSPFTDRGNGRRAEVGISEAGGAMDLYLSSSGNQEGLSPCHLKKAKLMFFYTRYPSSNILKTYFPDVKFSRCVTSQMIKWFSNFREFFYIQMERFARQAVQEALTQDVTPESRDRQLRVGQDTELYRILNMHYNKSNVYQVPDGFIKVSEVALREFYAAIWTGKDSDPCWKKAIYKMICKLDNHVPDAFRLPGCPVG